MIDQAHLTGVGRLVRRDGRQARDHAVVGRHQQPRVHSRPVATAYNNHYTRPASGPEILRNTTYYVDQGGVRIITLDANSIFLTSASSWTAP